MPLSDAAPILTIFVLATAMLLPVIFFAVWIWRSPFTLSQTLLSGLNCLLTRLLWRTRVLGGLDLKPGQGAVIVCNHRSSIDPTFIALGIPRLMHWMVAKEYCVHPAFRWFLTTCEVIPTNRAGIDTAATKMAIRYAREGGLVGIFPEGRINETDGLLLPGRPGAALIALKARVPVVPCYISGSPYNGTPWGALLMPAKVTLRIGRPMDISDFFGRENERQVLEELTQRFMSAIAELAGRPDFQPLIAGRFYRPEE
jgi:1-acyl-sn-glycerol-3-phosphate acyltransferase